MLHVSTGRARLLRGVKLILFAGVLRAFNASCLILVILHGSGSHFVCPLDVCPKKDEYPKTDLSRTIHSQIAGYGRQLTYRHDDGSFSAFGKLGSQLESQHAAAASATLLIVGMYA